MEVGRSDKERRFWEFFKRQRPVSSESERETAMGLMPWYVLGVKEESGRDLFIYLNKRGIGK